MVEVMDVASPSKDIASPLEEAPSEMVDIAGPPEKTPEETPIGMMDTTDPSEEASMEVMNASISAPSFASPPWPTLSAISMLEDLKAIVELLRGFPPLAERQHLVG